MTTRKRTASKIETIEYSNEENKFIVPTTNSKSKKQILIECENKEDLDIIYFKVNQIEDKIYFKDQIYFKNKNQYNN